MTTTTIQELYRASLICSERGLINSSKWAAEQLYSLTIGSAEGESLLDEATQDLLPTTGSCEQSAYLLPDLKKSNLNGLAADPGYMYAKALFDGKEFIRASHLLQNRRDERGIFLHFYCKLLVRIGYLKVPKLVFYLISHYAAWIASPFNLQTPTRMKARFVYLLLARIPNFRASMKIS